MKKNRKSIVIFAVISLSILVPIGFCGYLFLDMSKESSTKKIILDGEEFELEIADTFEKRERGLGTRKDICERCGMLFVFAENGRHSFWMKDMEFPLDILWLERGKIVALEKNIKRDSKKIFSPDVGSDQVLEVKAGTIDKLGIGIGDEIKIEK